MEKKQSITFIEKLSILPEKFKKEILEIYLGEGRLRVELKREYFRTCYDIPSLRLTFYLNSKSFTVDLDVFPGQCSTVVMSNLGNLYLNKDFDYVFNIIEKISKILKYSCLSYSLTDSSPLFKYGESLGVKIANNNILNKRTNSKIYFFYKKLY